ncbi:ROK family protein [Sphaerisporangium sp. NPDC005288]|uniref:ROK family protein n=1 Tax=Sphaerisporangium sp. NPDC005288 TaxID=3155114 RepID=UPI0033A69384
MEINVDYIAVHGTDLSGRGPGRAPVGLRRHGQWPGQGCARRVGLVAKEAVEAIRRAGAVPAGIAMAVPGLVDVTRGVVTLAPNLYWRALPLAELLSSLLGPLSVPVGVDKDAECGCGRIGCWEPKVGLAALVRAAMPEQAYGLPGMPVPDPGERVSSSGSPRQSWPNAQG